MNVAGLSTGQFEVSADCDVDDVADADEFEVLYEIQALTIRA
nr:hypothetical protein [Pseudomonas sp. ERMR1:02]